MEGQPQQHEHQQQSQSNGIRPISAALTSSSSSSSSSLTPKNDSSISSSADRAQPPGPKMDFHNLSFVSRTSIVDAKGRYIDTSSEQSVRNRDVQEAFFEHILGRRKELLEGTSITPESYDQIVLLIRKLREGIVSAGVYDAFVVKVYETSVDVCLDAENYAELLKSLSQLVVSIYETIDASDTEAMARRGEITGLYLMYLICYPASVYRMAAGDKPDFLSTGFRGDFHEALRAFYRLPVEVQNHKSVQRALRLLRAVVANLDFVTFRKIWDESGVSERKIISCIIPKVRNRVLATLTKACYTFPDDKLTKLLLCGDSKTNETGADLKPLTRILADYWGGDDKLIDRLDNGIVHLKVMKRK
ncbi:hypothetical protein HDU76_001913 [Blyttiomyces sp. JEL0837]|nr:hypothetical protein HDU76_001913 [Blyttiomyces sp. JEL0837]